MVVCGDDCNGECSGEVTGTSYCPLVNPCDVCTDWVCKLEIFPSFPCVNKIKYDAVTKGIDGDDFV